MHVCLFDIDGTLIASGGAGKAALERALNQEFGIARISDQLLLSGRTDRAICHDLFRFHGLPDTAETLRQLLTAYLRYLPEAMHEKARVLPGVQRLLACLSADSGVKVGLLTGNVRAGARAKLGHFDLFDRFAFGGFGDDHVDRDDVAREALSACRMHCGEVPTDRIWVIGDTPLDVRCARAIGAKAVAVATGWHPMEELATYQPDLLVADLSNPTALLDCLV